MSDQGSKSWIPAWLWIPAIIIMLLALGFCRISIRPVPVQATQPPCESGVWVQQEGGAPVCQPVNAGEPNAVTIYAAARFGADEEYATPILAAQAAREKLGNRPVKVYCDQSTWDTDLDSFIAELGKDTIFGVARDNFCQNGGYIEAWPTQ